MRLTLTLGSETGNIELPLRHNHIVQGLLYKAMGDRALRDYLHCQEARMHKRQFRLFTFSRLLGVPVISGETITYKGNVNLVVSSPIDSIIDSMGRYFVTHKEVWLESKPLTVLDTLADSPVVTSNEITVKTLSPVVAYSAQRKFTRYFGPWDEAFREVIAENLERKAFLAYGRHADTIGFEVTQLAPAERNLKVVYFRNEFVKGYVGVLKIRGDAGLLQAALDAGLGAKNNMGFGCLALVA